MTDWVMWFVLAGALVVLEMFTGTFYLLMIAAGFAAGGLASLAGAGMPVQLAIAALVGVAATAGLHRSRWGRRTRAIAGRDPNVNLDIGQSLHVDAWDAEGRTARVMYRGAMWDIELEAGATARPGTFIIREMRGNRLVVGNPGGHTR